MSFQFHLGDEIYAEVRTSLDQGNEWQISCRDVPSDWFGKLTSRTEKLYQDGDCDWFWVHRLHPAEQRFWVTDSNFGRLPVSDKMRPLYVRAIRTTLLAISSSSSISNLPVQDLSELKGILNRCLRKDQPDWLTLYKYLECPATGVLQYAVSELQHAIRSIKDKDEANAIKSIHRFENAIPPRLLTGILERIVTDSPALPEPTVSGSSANFYRATQEKGIASPETRLKLEQANRDHAETVARLSEVLTTRGYQAEHNRFIDVFCRLRTGSAIFEIKSLSVGNERSQCRHALSQLYEYRYIHSLTKATLWLVLSRKPSENWIVDYLCSDRDIHVVWLEDGTFFGPSIEQFNQI